MRSGGLVQVRSAPGRGATFRVLFVLDAVQAARDQGIDPRSGRAQQQMEQMMRAGAALRVGPGPGG